MNNAIAGRIARAAAGNRAQLDQLAPPAPVVRTSPRKKVARKTTRKTARKTRRKS